MGSIMDSRLRGNDKGGGMDSRLRGNDKRGGRDNGGVGDKKCCHPRESGDPVGNIIQKKQLKVFSILCILALCPLFPAAQPVITKEQVKEITLAKEPPIKFDPLNESAPEEIILFQELAKRSKEINTRENALKQQTLTLKAAEASMNEKLKHFDLLKQDLLKMLDKLKEKDEKQVEDLVKIYGSMKPKLAANILNQMDMPILKEIVKRMAKKKAALILAAMDTKKAKDLSQNLAKESQNIS